MYSLSMSFWIVPASAIRDALLARPRDVEASRIDAVALIVIDVDTGRGRCSPNSVSMSSSESMATPTRPTSPSARGSSESWPICVGRSNAVNNPVCPCASRNRKRSLVSGRAEARVLAHRPQPAAIHRGIHAARKRPLAAESGSLLERRATSSGLYSGRTAGPAGREHRVALRRFE